MLGLAKVAVGAMFVYLGMQVAVLLHRGHFEVLLTGWGAWYLVEMLGLVLFPMLLFIMGISNRNLIVVRAAAVVTMLGVIVNRLNISVIAFKWYAPVHYVPSVGEIMVTLTVVLAEIWVFRWIVLRMPVMSEHDQSDRAAPAAPEAK